MGPAKKLKTLIGIVKVNLVDLLWRILLQFVPYDTSVEILGDDILAFTEVLKINKPDALQILEKYEFWTPQSGRWYPQKTWLEALKDLSLNVGPTTLYILGSKILENFSWPPEVDNLQKGLMTINKLYHANHRNGKIGDRSLITFDEEKRLAKMMCNTPYPCDLERGIIMSVAMHFNLGDPRNLWVVHENPHSCRKRDIEDCTYIVRWPPPLPQQNR